MTKCAVEEMATVRLCAMVSELASTDKWLGYRFYLPEAWRAREENMAHDNMRIIRMLSIGQIKEQIP